MNDRIGSLPSPQETVLSTTETWAPEVFQSSASLGTTPKSSRKAPQPCGITQKQRYVIHRKLNDLIKLKQSCDYFNAPVDAKECPDYAKIIKKPMDICQIKRNFLLEDSHYLTINAIMEDFDLVINNAIEYNGVKHDISRAARDIQKRFKKNMKSVPGYSQPAEPEMSGTITTQGAVTRRQAKRSRVVSEDLGASPSSRAIRVCRETVQPTPRPKRSRRSTSEHESSDAEESISEYTESADSCKWYPALIPKPHR